MRPALHEPTGQASVRDLPGNVIPITDERGITLIKRDFLLFRRNPRLGRRAVELTDQHRPESRNCAKMFSLRR